MNKEVLVKRIASLEQEINQNRILSKQHQSAVQKLEVDYAGLLGSRQECNFWLNQVCENEVEKETCA